MSLIVEILKIVAPYMGAWIEIANVTQINLEVTVAPYMGAWIEITPRMKMATLCTVAPYMGAWIEIIKLRIA